MNKSFAELGLDEHILRGIDALGFTTPTPVQEQAIPLVLAGRDVIASAQTGTGKTAAFALPILQLIEPYSRAAREEQERLANAAEVVEPQVDAQAAPADAAKPQVDAQAILASAPSAGVTDESAPDAGDAYDGPDVLADDAPDGSASVSAKVDADGNIRPTRRPRRRHHKAATKPEADSQDGTRDAEGSHAADADKPKSGARRGGKSSASRKTAKAHKSEAGRSKADGKKRRRSRKRGSKGDASLAPNPNAHPFGPFALVVTPTRELAQQIEDVVSVVCEQTGQTAVVVMGGAKLDRQIRRLEAGCDLLVATPGRLLDLMEHGHLSLADVKVFVLDEADRMLDMGFWPSVRRIVAALPRERQTLLFSATIPPSIKGTVDTMLKDPATVEIARVGQTADTVEEHLCPVTQGQKLQLLEALLKRYTPERVLVFCRTKTRVDEVAQMLRRGGFKCDLMHSGRNQSERERALRRFRSAEVQVLVATDVMSRGIDISGIDAVVNFDVPMDPEDYVHRIGRTGRAGHEGLAFTFVAPDEISPLREIEYFTRKLVPVWDLDGFEYDSARIVPNPGRSTSKPTRSLFNGSRARGRGIQGGRYGRHY
ncbi:DEAD/DEAH box helicase [Parafannyhessea umbonata]|uniref:ATP-dependent RNA helicase RhlE n=1 Tax=Parafannyhessea umbonata TaxID=604330 RepID=A0A1H1NGE6_9ACTN|nr:DEAD/DEAH box helicase [Parafannyhessea umbonata]SDR97835.1 ATP-dependent RNA helicase RhlE [Parafannyhessea umbonata]